MVLGDLIGMEPGSVVGLDQLETVLVSLAEPGIGPAVEVVEDSEFDVGHCPTSWSKDVVVSQGAIIPPRRRYT